MASTALEACQLTVAALGRHAPARISVLVPLHDRLRRIAATGSWQIFATLPLTAGIAGRVFTSGRTETVGATSGDPALRPGLTAETCVPILNPTGTPFGVLALEWTAAVDLPSWQATAEQVGVRLGIRIAQLGGPPVESRDEKLLRHAAALTAAPDEPGLVAAAVDAARDVSGLAATILVLASPTGLRVAEPSRPADASPGPPTQAETGPAAETDPGADPGPAAETAPETDPGAEPGTGSGTAATTSADSGELERRIRASLTGSTRQVALDRLMVRVHDCGAAYTLGEADLTATAGPDVLLGSGAGTLIAVPVGPADTGGLLLVADERILRPDPITVNLLELLAAQAWICLDRLRSLAGLRQLAGSDPLTGLRHYGSFGERITATTPGRTALLAIDVDDFKIINDTYGHQAGDQVLVDLARALELALRQGDELYRVGGDEFVAVIEVGRPEEAAGIAERLVEAARKLGRTISVGVAVQHDAESPERTLRRADAALYDVKRDGRDGVRLAIA
jgi:diguanylate cyclase (GGDEF)-like protein